MAHRNEVRKSRENNLQNNPGEVRSDASAALIKSSLDAQAGENESRHQNFNAYILKLLHIFMFKKIKFSILIKKPL